MGHTMPSKANIFRGPVCPPVPPPVLSNVDCYLQQARTTFQYSATTLSPSTYRYIYMPKGTDVRCNSDGSNGDVVELPAGSGSFYLVIDIQDWHKGLDDEERRLLVTWCSQTGFPIA